MQLVDVCVIVILPPTEAALQVYGPQGRAKCSHVHGGEIACYFWNPVAQVLRAAGHRGLGELIAAIDGQPAQRGNLIVDRDAAALDLAQVFAHQQNRRGVGIGGDRGDGAIDLGEEVAGAYAAPAVFRSQPCFPTRCALTEQAAVGFGQLISHLR